MFNETEIDILLNHFGLDPADYLGQKGKPCPVCGGTDRFSQFKDTKKFYCRTCGPMDILDILAQTQDLTYLKAMHILGIDLPDRKRPKREPVPTIKNQSKLTQGSPATTYLRKKGFKFLSPWTYQGYCFHPHPEKELPVMVNYFYNNSGEKTGMHITFLDEDGHKTDYRPTRHMYKFNDSLSGSYMIVRYSSEFDETLITEGVEDAYAMAHMRRCNVIATGATALMEAVVLPQSILDNTKIYVCADNDESFAGQSSAYKLASKLHQRYKANVDVKVLGSKGQDPYDYWFTKKNEKQNDKSA